MPTLFRRKPLAALQEERARRGLRRTLGAWHLTALGIGAIIGAGIFATVGTSAGGDAPYGVVAVVEIPRGDDESAKSGGV